MASSDDEGEMVPKNVSDYEFISGNEESVSFSTLPIEWDKGGTHDGRHEQIFLSGKTDNGLLKIYKQVVAWKFDLPREKPEISVFSIDGYWIKLLKPRKPFLDIIRTIQITLYFLHFIKWNPQQSLKALWDYLNKTFSMFERKPSEDDLVDHMFLINEAVKRDETLANSKLLSTFLEEKPRKKTFNEDINRPFIVDDVNESEDQEEFLAIDDNGDNESDEDDCFDSVCAICDNGGHILICEGKCMRSFHATAEDGEESNCESLGFTDAELEAIKNIAFYCKNCEYKQHQCFVCGELGSSDESSGAQVFCCVNGACGHFYHPRCVAKLLHPEDNAAVAEHEKRIAAGEQFTCPAHKCHVCKELEVRSDDHLQFAICRRCPRAYHRKCLPREIAFEEDVDEEGEIIQRAWEDLIPNRVLIYCLEHEIDPDIATPVRDHIKFPGPQLNKKKKIPLESAKKKDQLKERGLTLEDDADKRIPAKPVDKVSYSSKQRKRFRKKVGKLPVQESSKKHKVATDGDKGEMSLGSRLYAAFYAMNFEHEKSSRVASVHGEHERTLKVNSTVNLQKDSLSLDADSQNRILNLMKDASSSITLDQVKERHKSPSSHAQNSKFYVDNITMGKVEGTVQAVRAALKKLDDGGNVLDAEAVCGKDLLIQVGKWKEKLKVYLAPFLYGMRYTSFGRHFTKLDKLKEIVDILHWYVRDGDMLVDFCCGSNDFSCLMKKKFDEMGRRCSFKNYDILQPKNDSCFERRDWMGVRPNELPDGSQLIMGLNPPFGVNAALANKFINKALEFKPKLLILIVPKETKRLDEKEYPYDLIWEDDQMFVGKSFYLPGSVDANDKQIEDWNVSAPVLYLWSRPDWTPKHKAIAEQHGHFPGTQKQYGLEEKENHDVMHVHNSSEECHNIDESFVNKGKDVYLDKPENLEQNGRETMSHLEGLPHNSNGAEGNKSCTREQNHSEANPTKSGGKRKRRRQSNSNLPEDKHSPSQVVYSGRDGHYQQSNQRSFSTYQPRSQTGYNGNQEVDGAIRARLYSLNGEEPRPGMSSRRARAPSPMLDFGLGAPSDRWMGWPKERGGNLPYRPYVGEVSVSYGREEPSPWNQRGGFRPPGPYPGAGFPSPRGPVNPAVDPMYGGNGMHASATQRYASRLGVDEFNHSLVARPAMQDTSGIHRPAFQAGSLGFAAAPYRPYSRHNSSGWLNE